MNRFRGCGKRRNDDSAVFTRRSASYDEEYYPPSRYARGNALLPPPSPFLQRMMEDYSPQPSGYHLPTTQSQRAEVLMKLGESVLNSLQQGKNFSTDPMVRETIETLKKGEEGNFPPPPTLPRGPHSRYDSFYESKFTPPCPPVQDIVPRFPLPPLTNDPTENSWYTFLRLGRYNDRTRIYASQHELAKYFELVKASKPLKLNEQLQTRLRNTFSYEINQNKVTKRHFWLVKHYDRIMNTKPVGLPLQNVPSKDITEEGGAVLKCLTESAMKKKKKKDLRDRRPPQTLKGRGIINYIKSLLFELCGTENKEHAVLVLRAVTVNPNIIKCLMTECSKFLELKFPDAATNPAQAQEKAKFLAQFQRRHIEETRKIMLNQGKSIDDFDETIFQEYEDLLSGKKTNPDAFSSPEDYVLEPGKTEQEFIVDFKYEFVRIAFEKFYFKIVDRFCVTKNLRKRVNFFMNNGFLAGLIVREAQGNPTELHRIATKYITNMDLPCKEAAMRLDLNLLEKVRQKNYEVETNFEDFCAKRKDMTPKMVEQFKACLPVFDPKASVVKYQLVDYTPYNSLSPEHKLYIFSEIIKFVYIQCLDFIVKDVDPREKSCNDMEKD